jgi:hypothetical protein
MLSVTIKSNMLNFTMLCVVMLNVILLNVVAPFALVHEFQMAVKSFITLTLAIFGKKFILRQKVL